MDDTNPAKEDTEYVDAIKEDIHWLGFDWGDRFFYGSDYFEKDYELAVELIKKGLAYVCELSPEEFGKYRGDLQNPAVSPYRDRPMEESLDLFRRMKEGEFPEAEFPEAEFPEDVYPEDLFPQEGLDDNELPPDLFPIEGEGSTDNSLETVPDEIVELPVDDFDAAPETGNGGGT
jgi:hypothetical protein